LRAAFQLFDLDGNGAIDAEELSATMLALAKAGRMAAPSDSQIAEMMSEADGDGACAAAVLNTHFPCLDNADTLAP
jgi:Ca2+-binding EF-hand superfamily protein